MFEHVVELGNTAETPDMTPRVCLELLEHRLVISIQCSMSLIIDVAIQIPNLPLYAGVDVALALSKDP